MPQENNQQLDLRALNKNRRDQNARFHLTKNFFGDPKKFGTLYLYQLGRFFCEKGQLVDNHMHGDYFELTIVTNGEGYCTTNGVRADIKKGDVYFSFPKEMHSIRSSEDTPLEYDFIAFNTKDKTFNRELDKIVKQFSEANKRIISSDRIRGIVDCAISEFSEKEYLSQRLVKNILNEMIIRVVRKFKSKQNLGNIAHLNKIDGENYLSVFCYKIMSYIDNNIYTIKNLYELSKVFNYSYTYISATFVKGTKMTIANYYRQKRLEVAKILLEERKISITDIAVLLNYSSVYTFSRAYKEKYGYSPKQERISKK